MNMSSTNLFNEDLDGVSLASRYDESVSMAQQRHRDDIRRVDRERKDQFEQQKQDLQSLRSEQQSLKDKFDHLKSRNGVLTNEVKTMREQLKTSLEKSKHDDELIEVLLKQQQQLKTHQEHHEKESDMRAKLTTELEQTYKLDQMKQANMIKHLQLIVDQKEAKIRELEMHVDENKVTLDDTLASINITSRHAPMQTVTVAPMQLSILRQPAADPMLSRLEKNGFTTAPSNSRPASAVSVKRSSVSQRSNVTLSMYLANRTTEIWCVSTLPLTSNELV